MEDTHDTRSTQDTMAIQNSVAKKLAMAADDAATQGEYKGMSPAKQMELRLVANKLRSAANRNGPGQFVAVRPRDVRAALVDTTRSFERHQGEYVEAGLAMLGHYGLLG